ncbi:IgGFc-binding protein, partial [Nannocystis sp.]|uniref:IgGFc-binding protein n=1 Tax=Nannocystis sp. TaxID=1962667 RepID=UPI0025FCC070
VASDLPIVAYQHAPRGAQLTNDASMLLPEPALAKNYVIASAREGTLHKNHRSYFVVIATTDDTTVSWTPPVDTIAGIGVPMVKAGQQGQVKLDRLTTLQVAAAYTVDLTGTYVSADKPIWVVGASACTSEPTGNHTCDHIEEQMLPIDYWGKTYVAAHAPKRGTEKYHWRVFGGQDGVKITTTPDQTGGPFTLMKGEFKIITTSQHFIMTGDAAFLPVQYLESQTAGAGTGDPSTVQMIPVEQFLNRYVFATGLGYTKNYVQIIRKAGAAAVTVDGVQVGGYVAIGGYELADWVITEGAHVAESSQPFAIINVGYTDFTSYAYPGGMKLDVITPQ